MTTEPSAIVQRAAAVIKEAAEFTPYWVPDKPETHQDPWTNAALALEAQGLLANQDTEELTAAKELDELLKAYGIGHVDSQVLATALAQIGYRKMAPPAPLADPWILLVCSTGNTNLAPTASFNIPEWEAAGWVIVSEWESREAVPSPSKRAILKRAVMIKQGWLPEPSAAVLAYGPSHPDHPEHVHEDCCK